MIYMQSTRNEMPFLGAEWQGGAAVDSCYFLLPYFVSGSAIRFFTATQHAVRTPSWTSRIAGGEIKFASGAIHCDAHILC